MIETKCEHIWVKHTNHGRELGTGSIEATFRCTACGTILSASDVFQLEELQYILGWQKTYAHKAYVVSLLSILVSVIAVLFAVFKK